jgi:hypothetical protein
MINQQHIQVRAAIPHCRHCNLSEGKSAACILSSSIAFQEARLHLNGILNLYPAGQLVSGQIFTQQILVVLKGMAILVSTL